MSIKIPLSCGGKGIGCTQIKVTVQCGVVALQLKGWIYRPVGGIACPDRISGKIAIIEIIGELRKTLDTDAEKKQETE